MKKEEIPYTVPVYLIFKLYEPRLTHLISKYFAKKKRKSADQRKTFISENKKKCTGGTRDFLVEIH